MKNSTASLVISRRRLGQVALSSVGALAGLQVLTAQAQGAEPVVQKPYLADMHSHLSIFMRLFGVDLPKHLHETGTTLLAWSLVDDARWTQATPQGYRQTRVPEAGELWTYFESRMADLNQRLRDWQLPLALTSQDVDASLAGRIHVVLATEGANFLEGQPERLAQAYVLGVRHVQLLHFIQSPLGDHQTAEPKHGGLTPTGARVVTECKRLGMLVDCAHGTAALVDGVLDASDAAPVWSHSWLTPQGGQWQEPSYIARSISLASAKKIAVRGGVVGLWSVRVNVPTYPLKGVASYADEIMRMCDQLDPAHVAFGSDMAGAGPNPVLRNYVDLREVAENLQKRGMSDAELAGVFIGNYARVVKAAMRGATPNPTK